MTSPADDYPATVDAVAGWLKVPEGALGEAERAHIAEVVPAVNSWIGTFRDITPPAPAHIVRGAVMLAGRIVRRRNSPAGIESFGDLGATYVARWDPDINMLLGLGGYRELVIG
ncbi:hypothetical protein GMA5_7 [Gordonia phage GMA5]|uniref:Head-to-tail adaptor n=1 Tax=Gordonia phage GMA5 TaxID=1647472 RepID=A0A0K0MWE5_9CAUD|nr:head-tail connector protein [Gordonia phage GMA5]AKI28621.1 hypothetical protein GMA5_7 [Gordonia phage GMA5]